MTSTNDALAIEQRHRDAAGELWLSFNDAPEPNSGLAAVILETIARSFARFERDHMPPPSNPGEVRALIIRAIRSAVENEEGLGAAIILNRDDLIADAIIHALPALITTPIAPAGEGWRDIASAPRDGTVFQAWVCLVDGGRGYWEPKCRFNPDTEAFEIWGRVDYDHDDWGCYGHLTGTHWMPEPEAPALTGIHGEAGNG